MANSEGIKAISEWFVRPEHEVEAAKQPYYLGPVDLFVLSTGPIQRGHLFSYQDQYPTRPTIQSVVERLKRSLSIVLVYFYPLSGGLQTNKYEDEHSCLIYVDCIKGPGARLVHATCVDLTVSDILSSIDVHPAVGSFFDLGERTVNHDGHTKPLLSIQLTELTDGVFIGFTVNHCVLDGTTFIHFVSTLSEIYKSDNPIQISRTPVYKMYFAEGYGPIFKLPYLDPEEFVSRADAPDLRERIFHFAPKSRTRLKVKANEESKYDDHQLISSFMALSGLVGRSIARASNLSGHDEEISSCVMYNARSRLDPPLSDNYIGNFVGAVTSSCSAEELLGNNLAWVATILVQELKKNTNEKICENLKGICNLPFVMNPGLNQPELNKGIQNNVIFGGSMRFNMYEPEFGIGRAVAVHMGKANKRHGKVTANAGRERGSVDLEICLRSQIMNVLETDEGVHEFCFSAVILFNSI